MMWQAFTLLIAAVAAVVTFLQWIIARQKVRLDLFDKRFSVFEELCEAIEVQVTKTTIEEDGFIKFLRAKSRARFLFGSDVSEFLDARHKDLVKDHVVRNNPKPLRQDQRQKAEDEAVERANRMSNFYAELEALILPYMQQAQKRRIILGVEI